MGTSIQRQSERTSWSWKYLRQQKKLVCCDCSRGVLIDAIVSNQPFNVLLCCVHVKDSVPRTPLNKDHEVYSQCITTCTIVMNSH